MSERDVQRYTFKTSVPAAEIEETLLLAVFAAEGLHGQSRVRLEATYCFDAEKHACVIDAGTEVGRDICRMFTGFALREFGDAAFRVSRADRGSTAEAEGVPSRQGAVAPSIASTGIGADGGMSHPAA